jgi:hypothetical protein
MFKNLVSVVYFSWHDFGKMRMLLKEFCHLAEDERFIPQKYKELTTRNSTVGRNH